MVSVCVYYTRGHHTERWGHQALSEKLWICHKIKYVVPGIINSMHVVTKHLFSRQEVLLLIPRFGIQRKTVQTRNFGSMINNHMSLLSTVFSCMRMNIDAVLLGSNHHVRPIAMIKQAMILQSSAAANTLEPAWSSMMCNVCYKAKHGRLCLYRYVHTASHRCSYTNMHIVSETVSYS